MPVARELYSITVDEQRNVLVDMSASLSTAEALTGSPTIQAPAGIVITNVQINTSTVNIGNNQVAPGQAVAFTVDPDHEDDYRIEILCSTDQGQRVEGIICLLVESHHCSC